MIEEYKLLNADMVGFTSHFYQNTASLAMARKLKQRKPRITTIMGGANVEFPMGIEILKNTDIIDFIFSGPALDSFPEFVRCHLNEEYEKCHRIKGVWSESNTEAFFAEDPEYFAYGEREDINSPAELNYDDFLYSYEKHMPHGSIKPFILYSTSRGCYWGEKTRCIFCAQGGPGGNNLSFDSVEPDNAVTLINSLSEYAGRVEYLYCVDSIVPRDYADKVFSRIRSEIPIHLEMSIHHNEQQIRRLSEAGVKITEAGIESLSSESLRIMRKGTTSFQNLRFLKNALLNDIFVIWNFLLGFPGEDKDTYQKICSDIPKLVHFPPGRFTQVSFERFSEYHDHPGKYGLELVPLPFYFLTYPFSRESVFNISSNFFDNGNGTYKKDFAEWMGRLMEKCAYWESLWQKKNRTFPQLYFKTDGPRHIIADTRFEEKKEYQISENSSRILKMLSAPMTPEQLIRKAPVSDIRKEIDILMEKDLLFYDDNRYYNIVFPHKPPIPTYFKGLG